jgi:hypothetical protein
LTLHFVGLDTPQLHKAEFRYSDSSRVAACGQGLTRYFNWTEVPQAFSLLCLDYLHHTSRQPHLNFVFRGANTGSFAASLGNARYVETGFLQDLFKQLPLSGGEIPCLRKVIDGINLGGKDPGERSIIIDSEFLPPDCVEVWRDEILQAEPSQIKALKDDIRRCLKELIEPDEPAPGPPQATESGPMPKTATDLLSPELKVQQPPAMVPEPIPQAGQTDLTRLLAKELAQALDALRQQPTANPSAEPAPAASQSPPEKQAETPQAKEDSPKVDLAAGENFLFELKAPIPIVPVKEPEPPLPPINPGYFTIPEVDGWWPDSASLLDLPDGEAIHQWTLKNAFEGVLILGRTGSGKTSGSGSMFAEALLRAGFGGLVLTVKKGEAEHWQRLCANCGREEDLRIIRRGGDWKLNVLAYEAQHPSQGAGLSENLTSFCRNLLRISTRSQGAQTNDPVWQLAGDQLLNATFDLFLLAGGGITFDRLADFVAAAPTQKLPNDEGEWLKIPVFGSLLEKAKNSLSSPEDKRIFGRATDYWFRIYPGYASKTRTSVTLGIFAMLDAFRGRDIPALISSTTNITPESIMSGLIVVLDLPLKELRHTGLMVQSAWKYLFQTALERCHNANSPKRRPVFLWEDEGQYFFSDHDHHFQDTARSSRVCRVILTQNLPGFYKEFGRDGADIANSVFGNLNTKIFHNNSDPATNEWAAKHFGQEIHTRYSFSQAPPPPIPQDFFSAMRQAIDPPSRTTLSGGEHWEYAVRPEEFNVLRTGGPENDFMVDAYITWMGLSAEHDRHFTRITFPQNQNL